MGYKQYNIPNFHRMSNSQAVSALGMPVYEGDVRRAGTYLL